MLIWIGIFMSTASVWADAKHSDGWFTIISPILTVLILLFLSGMPTAEGSNLQRYYEGSAALKQEYVAYREKTAPIVPCCPAVYGALPSPVKCAACCEYPMYEYKSAKGHLVAKTPV
jgi:steroid 5-alpha reductase family enzyme